jgi:hypothetical protein
MSFNTVANQIIQNSIVSSLYIDDKVVEPFETVTAGNTNYFEVSKGLYSSFKEKNKSLDFYKFELDKNWKDEADYIFKNRDLLVLDWQLDDSKELRQKDTLEILKTAVETDSLHFISIYTATERRHFTEIFFIIKAYFESGYNAETKGIYDKLISDLDAEGIETAFIKKLSGKFKEIAITVDNKEILAELKEIFKSELKDKYRLFAKCLREINPDTSKACEIFGYCINDEGYNTELKNVFSLNFSFIKDNFIVINHTIIQLTNKSNPKPTEHFSFFSEALLNVCGNLLTLTSLEIRNLLRDSSGFIGKDADSINEAALFHHQSQKENFFEFIVDIWKSHTLSFVDYNSDILNTLNEKFWEEYKTENKISEKIELLKTEEQQFYTELAKLNIYYNSLHLSKSATDRIKFGDVFMGLDEQGKPNGKYWLNISAHCDCLSPEDNLKNNFYFIAGSKNDLKASLTDGDGGFNSYLKVGNDILSLKWTNRPIVLNIQNSRMSNYAVKATDGRLKELALLYISTLKENYTQRMANNSFSFAMRVGIDFATI